VAGAGEKAEGARGEKKKKKGNNEEAYKKSPIRYLPGSREITGKLKAGGKGQRGGKGGKK